MGEVVLHLALYDVTHLLVGVAVRRRVVVRIGIDAAYAQSDAPPGIEEALVALLVAGGNRDIYPGQVALAHAHASIHVHDVALLRLIVIIIVSAQRQCQLTQYSAREVLERAPRIIIIYGWTQPPPLVMPRLSSSPAARAASA